MTSKDIKFYFRNNQYYCSVQLPIDSRPTIYMCLGHDNRPFDAIIEDINCAFDILLANYNGDQFVRDYAIAYDIPNLLGYKGALYSLAEFLH